MDLVIGHTEYELDPSSNLWLQRVYTCDLLKRVLNANQKALGKVSSFLSVFALYVKQ